MPRGRLAPKTHIGDLGPTASVLGIDEAGRGSVLGPLVVGGFLTSAEALGRLGDLGVRDSKQLTPSRRAQICGELPELGRCFAIAVPPAVIDASVRKHGLNHLEARTFGRLVRRARPQRAYVDACDVVAARFGAEVARSAGVARSVVDARHHADRDLLVVAAASIVAKVRRDRAIARLERELGVPLGSGYPSDPVTRRFVEATLKDGTAPPGYLRASWKTTETLMPKPTARPLEAFVR